MVYCVTMITGATTYTCVIVFIIRSKSYDKYFRYTVYSKAYNFFNEMQMAYARYVHHYLRVTNRNLIMMMTAPQKTQVFDIRLWMSCLCEYQR